MASSSHCVDTDNTGNGRKPCSFCEVCLHIPFSSSHLPSSLKHRSTKSLAHISLQPPSRQVKHQARLARVSQPSQPRHNIHGPLALRAGLATAALSIVWSRSIHPSLATWTTPLGRMCPTLAALMKASTSWILFSVLRPIIRSLTLIQSCSIPLPRRQQPMPRRLISMLLTGLCSPRNKVSSFCVKAIGHLPKSIDTSPSKVMPKQRPSWTVAARNKWLSQLLFPFTPSFQFPWTALRPREGRRQGWNLPRKDADSTPYLPLLSWEEGNGGRGSYFQMQRLPKFHPPIPRPPITLTCLPCFPVREGWNAKSASRRRASSTVS